MSFWSRYRELIASNLSKETVPDIKGVDYWRDKLFYVIVVYTLPVCMIAYIPAMAICYYLDQTAIAFYDSLAIVLIVLVTFSKRLSLRCRKLIYVFTLYLLSVSLLYYMGAYGPGLLYLLSTVIFVSLIYSSKLAYWCILINTVICLLFALGMQLQVMDSAMVTIYTPEAWLAVASNQVLLSILFAASIQMLTSGFTQTLEKESSLKENIKNEVIESARLVKELKIKNEEMEQFTYIASHDLQEPLNTILGITEVLKLPSAKSGARDFEKGLDYISFSVERLKMLIKGLLDYSRIGRQLAVEQVRCEEVIKNVASDLRSAVSESGAKLIIDESVRDMDPVAVFPLDFNQLFQNLISNAIKFRSPAVRPVIEVSVKERSDFFEFLVKDNGIGIDKDNLDKIFVIFKRAHSDTSYQGTGIGLAFCKKIVELHGGKIWVESKAGSGSSFYFTISRHLAK
ncbi:ATP-binding protein [uncultured Imperialibacter sp.]|uniref:sensor histidine kinase n=1 Tax=uncultured Imperialibacter sp. TaxID=1672639 RepID=UPI0030DC3F55|tara:strand:- start:5414 stop:6781 length:1368 start_codon:yes stop_codon:yes gene_type:complete